MQKRTRASSLWLAAVIVIALLAAAAVLFRFGGLGLFGRPGGGQTEPSDPEAYYEFVAELENGGIKDPMIPKYWPRDYISHEVVNAGDGMLYCLFLKQNDSEGNLRHMVTIEVFSDPRISAGFPKDDGEPESYVYHDQEFLIFTNYGSYRCIWSADDINYFLSCEFGREEMLKMIQSIFD